MNVSQAMQERRSVRAFLPRVPGSSDVHRLIADAAQSASGGNLQPWRVTALAGAPLAQLVAAVTSAEPTDDGEVPHMSYPPSLWDPYRTRRFKNGEDLYKTIDIPREDKAARLEQLARNGLFFGAPVGVIVQVDERMGYAQWLDLGIYLQSFMLLATERGMATCPQGYWRRYRETVERVLEVPHPYRVAYGIALGYEDTAAPINALRADRAAFGEWAQLRGF
ncbi:nitroreductase [Diaphorobacter aerolatus]|uniref:Nitroreductase n=1 Tax=Diaphorobacter aerolatus TaxID=1288495 RepID=A0A7H0GMF5_9BURK|nr:nitroreductase [Diaphorobacter aerolatus]QNP49471.1 nitroreductase [Diaphorobacter aerolatus]